MGGTSTPAPAAGRSRDDGFTLAELLIVIVVLGILATVTVAAMRGISDQSRSAACDTEIRDLGTSQASHLALVGTYGDEASLVANGALKAESTMYDVSIAPNGVYTIVPAAGSKCTGTSSGGGGGGGLDRSGYTISLADLVAAGDTFQGIPSLEYNQGGGADEVLIFGRAEGEQDFVDMVNAAPPNVRRIAFINLDNFADNAAILAAMNASRTNGYTTFALYPDDDPGGAVEGFIQSQIGVGPNSSLEDFVLLDVYGGPNPTLTVLLPTLV